MFTFIIKMICVVLGLTSFVLLSMGKNSNSCQGDAGHAPFEDARYIQIKDTDRETARNVRH